jgi:2,4-dienoyl-CoA reductase-like NADH-dependent reductase (Old Yellow Enzyme family)
MISPASCSTLFTPFDLKAKSLRNRIVMAPMTRKLSPNGVPGQDVAAYYARRSEHDVALIITEGIAIDHPAAVDHADVPRLSGEAPLRGWRRVVDRVHAAGGLIVAQLWHMGSMRGGGGPHPETPSIGPSRIVRGGGQFCGAMAQADIDAVVDAYARGAGTALKLGFDGVELHAAHGYLIDQFFWTRTNRRQDCYGGDVIGRARFAVEVVRACRRIVGPAFPIIMRFSQWKLQDYSARIADSPAALLALLSPLALAGVDMFHCSTRSFSQPEFDGSDRNLAAWTKALTGKPVITVGGVGQQGDFLTGTCRGVATDDALARVSRLIDRGEVDLVAVGRGLLADAEWVIKVRDGRTSAIRPFTREALATLH